MNNKGHYFCFAFTTTKKRSGLSLTAKSLDGTAGLESDLVLYIGDAGIKR